MPVYEYQCKECGSRFERVQSFHDNPVKICPECKGNVQRLIQPARIIFKGSGFYVNDSRGSRKNLTNGKPKEKAGKAKSKKESKETTSSSSDSGSDKD